MELLFETFLACFLNAPIMRLKITKGKVVVFNYHVILNPREEMGYKLFWPIIHKNSLLFNSFETSKLFVGGISIQGSAIDVWISTSPHV